MTRRISALAVWWASASCVSLNIRAFWIAMTAWSAKVFSSCVLLVGVTAGLAASHDGDRADALAFPQQRRDQHR